MLSKFPFTIFSHNLNVPTFPLFRKGRAKPASIEIVISEFLNVSNSSAKIKKGS
jgi:hypothetical protein